MRTSGRIAAIQRPSSFEPPSFCLNLPVASLWLESAELCRTSGQASGNDCARIAHLTRLRHFGLIAALAPCGEE